jgi:hypothetical protein
MKKYLLHLSLITISLAGCNKQHTDTQPQLQQQAQQQTPTLPSNPDTVSGKYVLYLELDTVYDYYSATQFNYDVTHETLTGDTVYLKAGTANQVIQPNPIAGYDPKVALADTVYVTKGSTGYQFSEPSNIFTIGTPGSSTKFYLLNKNRVELIYKYIDDDNAPGMWTDVYGVYYKKL